MSSSKSSSQKLRLFYIIDILTKYSDENNPLNTNDIIDFLKDEYDIACERKTIYDDISCLSQYGFDIIKSSKPRGYFLAYNTFELPELRMLIDAVQAANFISVRKTKQLLEKFAKYTNVFASERISKQIYIDNRHKTENKNIFYIIDELHNAIINKHKVNIVYKKRIISNENKIDYSKKEMLFNPYAMTWSNDRYYLIGNYNKYNNIINLRIDRIVSVTETSEQCKSFETVSSYIGRFDTADYVNKHLSMFSGEIMPVELICNNEKIDDVVDRFGDKVKMTVYDENHFKTYIDVAVNEGLVSWIMQYGKSIKVCRPRLLTDMIIDRTNEILQLYGEK